MGHYRKQWEDVPVDYLTFSGTYDMKLYPGKRDDNDFWGIGFNFNYDRAGFSKLSLTQFQFGGAYSKELSKNVFLTGGAQIGFAQRAFKPQDLTFDNQFNGEMFDATLPTGEDLSNTNFFFADLSLGANLRLQHDNRRSKVDFGVSLYHLNRPKQSFLSDDDIKLPNRFAFYGIGAIKLANAIDILGHMGVQLQGPYEEFIPGIAFRLYLNEKRGKEFAFQAGCNLRFNQITDAVIPTIELHFQTLSVGFSYDVNLSEFDIATADAGGPELWVAYRIIKVKPLSQFKTCPIF